ncbi:ABC transporter substrate-binding protein [Desulfococcaceae bacterium HSG8]|nr:ABC transporter substrate-binding protein [Desulfococcaceae bacterium HSG8]
MKHRLKLVFALIFAVSVIGNFIIPGISSASEPVTVGVLHWKAFAYADMMKNSYEMALEDINKAGGINGRPLKLVYADDQGKRDAGEKAVAELADKGVAMLIGGYASSNTIYTARRADRMNMPFLICTAADDRITQRKWKNVFRLNPPAGSYTIRIGRFFSE